MENRFGHPCGVCDRLWFKNDLKPVTTAEASVLVTFTEGLQACLTCHTSLKQGKVPTLAVSNGFRYPNYPTNPSLPPLDPIAERLISPRLPFMQIRRLRFAAGKYSILFYLELLSNLKCVSGNYGIIGQVINVPVDVDKMVKELPRQLDDDRAFNVSIKKHLIHKSSYLSGFV